MQADRERCLEAGMDGFLAKPFVRAALLDALASALRGEGAPAAARSGRSAPFALQRNRV
jgi:CheY-like chemotaxis protein